MSEENQNEIRDVLEDIKQLLILTNKEKLDEVKKELLESGSNGEKVYKLCDGKHDNAAISKESELGVGIVRARISDLRNKGLIRTKKVNGEYFHFRIF